MAFEFTKTLGIIAVAQMVLRAPLTYVVDPVPFASFGVFWSGVAAVPMLLIIGLIADTGTGAWWLLRRTRRR